MTLAAQYDFFTNTRMLDRGIYTSVSQPPSINLCQYWALEVQLLLGKWYSSPRDLPHPKTKRASVQVMNYDIE